MTDLGVAHLTLGQANRPPPGRELGCPKVAHNSSKTGVSANPTALPGPGGARPHPSRITRQTEGDRRRARAAISPRRRDDAGEVRRIEARAPHQRAVDVGLCQQLPAFSGLTLPP